MSCFLLIPYWEPVFVFVVCEKHNLLLCCNTVLNVAWEQFHMHHYPAVPRQEDLLMLLQPAHCAPGGPPFYFCFLHLIRVTL